MTWRWKTIRKIWVLTGSAAFLLFTVWNVLSYRTWNVEVRILQSDARVSVTRDAEAIRFLPADDHAQPGLLYFPGALVNPEAYAPFARRVAEAGYPAIIVLIPLRNSPLADESAALQQALRLMESSPSEWIVGGHSRGGYLAARFAQLHADKIKGLLLVGTSHPHGFDLSRLTIPVTRVFGSRDGLASEDEVKQFAGNLPAHASFERVEGGNHAQFGYYGFQFGDRTATISREQQHDALFRAAHALLAAIEAQHRK